MVVYEGYIHKAYALWEERHAAAFYILNIHLEPQS